MIVVYTEVLGSFSASRLAATDSTTAVLLLKKRLVLLLRQIVLA
jgi:hypothetical protein